MNNSLSSNLLAVNSVPGGASTPAKPAADSRKDGPPGDFRNTMDQMTNRRDDARRDQLARVADQRAQRQDADRTDAKPAKDQPREPVAATDQPHSADGPEKPTTKTPSKKSDKVDDDSSTDGQVLAATDQAVVAEEQITKSPLGLLFDPASIPAVDDGTLSATVMADAENTALTPVSPLNPDGIILPLTTAASGAGQGGTQESIEGLDALAIAADGKSGSKAIVSGTQGNPDESKSQDGDGAGENVIGLDSNKDSKASFSKLLGGSPGEREALPIAQVADKATDTLRTSVLDVATRALEPSAPVNRGFVVQTGVPMTMGQPGWSQAVGERVLWLAAQNLSSAEIRLDPPELGPMQVRISIQNDQANVSFSSQHLAVREALDQSALRLRDMFTQQGLNLVNVDVSDQSFARHQAGHGSSGSGGGSRQQTEADLVEESLVGVSTNLANIRLVDHYA